jgi:glycosyltransferase involved in cell wall biosynthesis
MSRAAASVSARPAAPRHISIVTETYPPDINGVASTLARLVSGLRGCGHAVSVVRPRRPALDGADPSGDPGLTLVLGVPLPWYREVRLGVPSPGALRKRWTTHRPDVAYVATEGPLGLAAVRAAERLGVPLFSGFHTNFHGHAPHYRAGWLRPLIVPYLRRFHNRTQGTLVASAELRSALGALGFRNLRVLGRGVDGGLFTPEGRSPALRASWGAADHDLVVLYVGRVAPEKNIPLAIEAYRAMQGVAEAVRFVVVGDGPLRPALERAHPDVQFCGVRTGMELAAHYASADVFLFPSETETFGNVTVEAMASGLAVVAYDYAAARMHIRHGDTGVLAPCGAPPLFVERAAALARSPRAIREMGRRAREYAAGRLHWQRVVDRFEAILTERLPAAS